MTGDEFFKYNWRAYEVVEYHHERLNTTVQCAVLALDFDCHTMKLVPIANIGFEEHEFWCAVSQIRKIVRNQKLKITK